MQTQLILRVYGRIWNGSRACYQYTITDVPKSDEEAKHLAGDFESLIDWHVIQETNEYEWDKFGLARRVDTFKTLKGWSAGFTNRRYARMVNA